MKTCIVVLISCLTYVSQAQLLDSTTYIWSDGHIALGNVYHANTSGNFSYKEYLFSYQAGISGQGAIFSRESESLQEHNLLAGYIRTGGISYVGVQSGLSFLKHKRTFKTGYTEGIFFDRPTYDTETNLLIGVPIVMKAGISAKVISIQMTVGTNLNTEMSTLYLGLGLGFGKLF